MRIERIAGAPISWGVCDVPGWGVRLGAGRVAAELASLGLRAVEFGPPGYLGAALLERHGLRPVGGYVPLVLHDAAADPLPEAVRVAEEFLAAGAPFLVVGAEPGAGGRRISGGEWSVLLDNLDRIAAAMEEIGAMACLHPHAGTVVERREEIWRVLAETLIPLCLDTGHAHIGGADPVELARDVPERIVHVHLKDVAAGPLRRMRAGEIGYEQAVAEGLYPPLGRGEVDLAGVVAALEEAGYTGWYVLEQDVRLPAEPPPGAGPVADARAGLEYVRALPG
ncbi:inosose dehydratase [Thermocatellispora tengchongensis]|uniref:Inosose dehydratase n=1 Tax=Thermocatellispora tengchongensis TaxID=1073253 RepID=A0A840PM13_9ACTN|nr:TIM barrel protein [Thermocatellispora tengchongensis]MBB5137085.1 inosose dehydratase [Thermocatellispora tengchongensis]